MDAIERVFGKKLQDLTDEEKRVWRRAVRTARYYRDHERGKHRNRTNARWRKRDVIQALGIPARCQRCGYDRYIGALDFHHRDPAGKAMRGLNRRRLAACIEEAKKCDLICANCHREHHREQQNQNGGRPQKPLHPQVAAYLEAVGVIRPELVQGVHVLQNVSSCTQVPTVA